MGNENLIKNTIYYGLPMQKITRIADISPGTFPSAFSGLEAMLQPFFIISRFQVFVLHHRLSFHYACLGCYNCHTWLFSFMVTLNVELELLGLPEGLPDRG